MGATNANLLRGTLELVILRSLSLGTKHGYAVSEWIEAATVGEFLIEEGTLYPALHRLEKRGLIRAWWGLSEKNRKAKYYELTRKGRQELARDTQAWQKYAEAVARALGGVEALWDPKAKRVAERGLQHIEPTEDRLFELLLDDGLLCRTPIVRLGEQATVGRDEAGWKALFEQAKAAGGA